MCTRWNMPGGPRTMILFSTAGSLGPGNPFERERWCRTQNGPQKQTVVIPKPPRVEPYYAACAIVDQHNGFRQDSLRL